MGRHSDIRAAHATTVVVTINPIVAAVIHLKVFVLFTRKTSKHTEALMNASAQKRMI